MTTKLEQAARQALEALETDKQWGFVNKKVLERRLPAIAALRSALDHSSQSASSTTITASHGWKKSLMTKRLLVRFFMRCKTALAGMYLLQRSRNE